MMTEWRDEVSAALKAVQDQLPDVELYVFGSYLTDSNLVADVDVVVVYCKVGDVEASRELLDVVGASVPLHLIFLSRSEVRELDFLATVKAVPIADVTCQAQGHSESAVGV